MQERGHLIHLGVLEEHNRCGAGALGKALAIFNCLSVASMSQLSGSHGCFLHVVVEC